MNQYTFEKYCNSDKLTLEIHRSSITEDLAYIEATDSTTHVYFQNPLSSEEQTELSTIVEDHVATNLFTQNYAYSSFAVDKDYTDQEITDTGNTIISLERVLWDTDSNVVIENNSFAPGGNSVYNINGTITVITGATCTRVYIHIFRNDELYFTVASVENSGIQKHFIVFSCDIDGYATNNHEFDLRIQLEGDSPTATISGSAEETAWGASFVTALDNLESPT